MLDPATPRSLCILNRCIGAGSALLACLVLLGGWGLGIDALKSVLPGLVTMKANTSLCIVNLGIALTLDCSNGRRVLARAAACAALLIGVTTLLESALDWNAHIDQLLFTEPLTAGARPPGRPAAATAVMVCLLACALLCGRARTLQPAKTAAALVATLIAWVTLNVYLFGGSREVPPISSVALHSAAMLLLLSLGVLATPPATWPIRTALATGTGGVVCRWLLPPAILAPPLLGWSLGHSALFSAYSPQLLWAVYAAASSLGSVWLILMLAHRITVVDMARSAATELSRHDPLTGLANRRAFDEFLLEASTLARHHGQPLSLVLLDMDHFKAYNDTYGHPAGDELLRRMGELLAGIGRKSDLVARIGGEEFALVLPQTDAHGAHVLAERARALVERSTAFRRRMSVSVGVATLCEQLPSGAALVEECDAALYRAKRNGRNQVVHAPVASGTQPA